MMDRHHITRRTVILGLAGTALAAVAVAPVVAATVSPLRTAIGQHKAAMRCLNRLLRQMDELEALPGRPTTPKVIVGHLVQGRDINGETVRQPLYGRSHDDIEAHAQRWIVTAYYPALVASYRAKFDGYHRELTRQIRARAKFDRASGLTALEVSLAEAYRIEAEAEAGVLLAMPMTQAEGQFKAAYINRSDLLCNWTESPVAYGAVMRGLCAVSGRGSDER
ncbi:MAG: hypothetical protein ABIQ30_08005 [Devosia sp.]